MCGWSSICGTVRRSDAGGRDQGFWCYVGGEGSERGELVGFVLVGAGCQEDGTYGSVVGTSSFLFLGVGWSRIGRFLREGDTR